MRRKLDFLASWLRHGGPVRGPGRPRNGAKPPIRAGGRAPRSRSRHPAAVLGHVAESHPQRGPRRLRESRRPPVAGRRTDPAARSRHRRPAGRRPHRRTSRPGAPPRPHGPERRHPARGRAGTAAGARRRRDHADRDLCPRLGPGRSPRHPAGGRKRRTRASPAPPGEIPGASAARTGGRASRRRADGLPGRDTADRTALCGLHPAGDRRRAGGRRGPGTPGQHLSLRPAAWPATSSGRDAQAYLRRTRTDAPPAPACCFSDARPRA